MKILIEDLRSQKKQFEGYLKDLVEEKNLKNVEVEIRPYFAYGKYSNYINVFVKDKDIHQQYRSNLGTKKECYNELYKIYHQAYDYINSL